VHSLVNASPYFFHCRWKTKDYKLDGSDWSSTLICHLQRLSYLAARGTLEAPNIC